MKPMSAALTDNAYGKSKVRLTKVVRGAGGVHQFFEFSVDIQLRGDFADSYTAGDNSKIIATDSMKNTVYVLAKEQRFASPEEFALLLARHFVATYPQVTAAAVDVEETPWDPIHVAGHPHRHAFVGGGAERRIARANATRASATLSAGITDLVVLKTTASEFHGFVTDRYRTLKDTRDRIFATSVNAEWDYATADPRDPNGEHWRLRVALLETFATHHSLAVQQTLLAMGEAALAACAAITRIRLQMPNQHRIPFNFEPFGLKNENDIFVTTDEPYGVISGTVERNGK